MHEVSALWIGERLSTMERMSLSSFVPYYTVRLYTYGPVHGVPDGVNIADAREVMDEKPWPNALEDTYTTFSNVFRYKLLYEQGGTWIDCDIVLLRPFDDLPVECYCLEDAPGGGLKPWAGFIRAVKGSPTMGFCWRQSVGPHVPVRFGYTSWEVMQEAFALRPLSILSPKRFTPVPWYEAHTLVDANPPEILPDSSYGVHLWSYMWKVNNMDKDGKYPRGCLYERLKRGEHA